MKIKTFLVYVFTANEGHSRVLLSLQELKYYLLTLASLIKITIISSTFLRLAAAAVLLSLGLSL